MQMCAGFTVNGMPISYHVYNEEWKWKLLLKKKLMRSVVPV
jgi:hypothetical protein